MLKRFTYLTLLIITALIISSCDNDDFVSPYDITSSVAQPTNLQITQISASSVKLTWNDNCQGEEGYKISRKKDNELWVDEYAVVGENIPEYIDRNIIPNSEYRYIVKAYYDELNSNYIELSINTLINAPSNLQITQESVSSVRLTWEDNYQWEEGYKISRKKDDEEWVDEYAVVEENMQEYIDDSLELYSVYRYRIKAYYQDNESTSLEVRIGLAPENFIFISAGLFTMGYSGGNGYSNELPVHEVAFSSYVIGKYEVTQAEYQALMGNNPSYFLGSDKPVENVSWYDVVEYCNARSIEESLTPCYDTDDWSCDFSANGYRLPTEAEWEYAARGASNDPDYLYSGSDNIESVAWYSANSGSTTHTVGTKSPNSLGIYDMSGNVWEWCNDWYGDYSSSVQSDPIGPATGSYRVIRGGSWGSSATHCRVAFRSHYTPTLSYNSVGFRIVRKGE